MGYGRCVHEIIYLFRLTQRRKRNNSFEQYYGQGCEAIQTFRSSHTKKKENKNANTNIFCGVTPCSSVEVHRLLSEKSCLYLLRERVSQDGKQAAQSKLSFR
jgi:hypothetical protein